MYIVVRGITINNLAIISLLNKESANSFAIYLIDKITKIRLQKI